MKSSKGNATLAVLLGVVVLAVVVIGMAVGFYNTANSLSQSTVAQWQSNQSRYDGFWKMVKETAQVTDKYKTDFKNIFIGAIEGRYKDNGMGQMFAMIKEENPRLDASLYTKIQQVIEAGRGDFMRSQDDLLDKQRRLGTHLSSATGALFSGFLGLPKEVLGDLRPPRDKDGDGKYTALDYPIVTSGKTKEVFSTGEDNAPVDVFGK